MKTGQLTIFGESVLKEMEYFIFHDECGTYVPGGGDRWLVHGLLLVEVAYFNGIVNALAEIRRKRNYFNEIKCSKIRHAGKGPLFNCAKDWINYFQNNIVDHCYYYCLAVDTHSRKFDHTRFAKPYHVYNFFAKTACVGAIAWCLKGKDRVRLRIFSDSKVRKISDNFCTYLPIELVRTISQRRTSKPSHYPEIILDQTCVSLIDSNPQRVGNLNQNECEIIQLVDLITGCINNAYLMTSTQHGRFELSKLVYRWIEDTQKPPWQQNLDLHRKFNVSFFYPDSRDVFIKPKLAIADHMQEAIFQNMD